MENEATATTQDRAAAGDYRRAQPGGVPPALRAAGRQARGSLPLHLQVRRRDAAFRLVGEDEGDGNCDGEDSSTPPAIREPADHRGSQELQTRISRRHTRDSDGVERSCQLIDEERNDREKEAEARGIHRNNQAENEKNALVHALFSALLLA